MKIAGGIKDNGVVVGNIYDKYGSKNPIVRKLMKGFHQSLSELVDLAKPENIHEIGCGEGFWVIEWNRQGISARGSDFSSKVIGVARENALENELQEGLFKQLSIYDVDLRQDSADLVVCCEVLEHLEQPEEGLRALQSIVANNVIVSVPREPLWRALNLARGKYISALGNTPGHLQHWSKSNFVRLVEKYFDVIERRSPLPWTMLLAKRKSK